MADQRLIVLRGLVDEAERLRARGLALMQGAPGGPVSQEDRDAYARLLDGARTEVGEVEDVDEPGALATVARLHRCAGLLEHHLLRALAEEETAA